jgi:hypothetical protein
MGAADGKLDVWLWEAAWRGASEGAPNLLDDYPFDGPLYRDLTQGKEKGIPDFLTARAAGNLHTNSERTLSASSLGAQGFGSTTFLPRPSQLVTASSARKSGRWEVVFRRPLAVRPEDGYGLVPGQRYSIAFAIWDGAARDRNGQKLISIWHDLQLE